MTAEQKAEYEREQREAKLAAREADIALRELKAEATKTLAAKDLPVEVLDLVIAIDAKTTNERIDTFKAQFDKAVQAGVEARLQGKTPSGGSGKTAAPAEEQARKQFANALKGGI